MISRSVASGLLVDLDGVLRRWDPEIPASVEARHGLPAGTLWRIAFAPSRLVPVITGQTSHADWMSEVADALGDPAVVAEWEAYRGEADPEVLAFVREVRSAGSGSGWPPTPPTGWTTTWPCSAWPASWTRW
jgi:putative hydrolase of the HAD superfamily